MVLASVQSGSPPDVAVLSTPGDLVSYIRDGRLYPLNDVLDERERAAFRDLWLLPKDGRVYTVPVKVNLKGLIWYNTEHVPAPPRTWDELMDFTANQAVTPWCVGMSDGPGSGWPGTDLIEDLLLRQSGPAVYERWVSGDLEWDGTEVVRAWRAWGSVVDPRFVHGGQRAALLTDFMDAGKPMFTDPPGCLLESQASFAMGFYQGYPEKPVLGKDFDFFPVTERGQGQTVSADLAGMFNDTPQARQLMHFLATDAPLVWLEITGSGAFSASERVEPDVYDDEVSRRIATILRSADPLCFDASDVMPPTMRIAFYRAVLEYLNNPGDLATLLLRLDQERESLADEDWLPLRCDG
jgi:alpha-glucoside transport system substrate-binding protein